MDRRDLRVGIIIGALAAAVVALGVVVVVLLLGDDDDSSPPVGSQPSTETTPVPPAEDCTADVAGVSAYIAVITGDISCEEARAVYSEYEAAVEARDITGSGGFANVGEFECHAPPSPEYPLLIECESQDDRFQIKGNARSDPREPPAPQPSFPEDYFVSKSKWRSYPPDVQLEAAEVFISYNQEVCPKGATAADVVEHVNTAWLAGDLPVENAGMAMFNYCAVVLGGQENLPPGYDY